MGRQEKFRACPHGLRVRSFRAQVLELERTYASQLAHGDFVDVLAIVAGEFQFSQTSELEAWAEKGYCKRCLRDYARERYVVLRKSLCDLQEVLHRAVERVELELRRLRKFQDHLAAARDAVEESLADRPDAEPVTYPAYVYAISNGTHVKIGIAGDPVIRLAALQTASPVTLVLLGAIPQTRITESEAHAKFLAPALSRRVV